MYRQVERYRETILIRLIHYDADQQDNWDILVRPLNYTYNPQGHSSANAGLLNIVLTRTFLDRQHSTALLHSKQVHIMRRNSTLYERNCLHVSMLYAHMPKQD